MRGVLAASWIVIACGVAIAQPQDRNKSARLFNEGRDLAKQNKWVEACERFDQSLQLDRAPGTSLNYGDCLEHLGQLRKAWQMYDAAARDFERDKDARSKFARERADAVVPKLTRLVIKVADPKQEGLVITVGDTSVAVRSEITELVEPGDVAIKATAPGRAAFTARASGTAGASVIVEIPPFGSDRQPTVVTRGPDEAELPQPVDAPEGRRKRSRVYMAAGVGGAGIIAVGVSVGLGLSAKSNYDDAASRCMEKDGVQTCPFEADKDKIRAAGDRADLATGFAIGGGVLVAAGVVLFLTAPREHMTITPAVSASSAGLAFSGRF